MRTLFSITGWILVALSIIAPLSMIIAQIGEGSMGDMLYDILVEGIIPGAITFVLGFFPGRYLIGTGRGKRKENGLNKTGLVIAAISVILSVVCFILGMNAGPDYGFGYLFIILLIGAPLYGISLILLIIDYFKQK